MREKLMKSSIASLLIASSIFTYNMNAIIKADETETVPSTEERTELTEAAAATEESSEETTEEAPEKDLLVKASPENAPEQEVQQQAIAEYNAQAEADETAPIHEIQDSVPVESEGDTLESLEAPANQPAPENTGETTELPSEEMTEEVSAGEAASEEASFEPAAEQTGEGTSEETAELPMVDDGEATPETSTEAPTTEPEEETSSEPVEEPTGEATLEESTEQPTVEAPTGGEASEPTAEVPADEPMEEEVTDESSAGHSTEEPAIEYDGSAEDGTAVGYGNEESGTGIYPSEQPLSGEAEKETSEVQSVGYYRYDYGNILEGISLNPGASDDQLNLLDKRVNRLMAAKIMPEDEVDEADILKIEEKIKNEEGVMASTDRDSLPDTGEADYTFLYGTTLLIAGAILLFITRKPNKHKCK